MTDIVIVGATGFIGRCLITNISCQKEIKLRVLVHRNSLDNLASKNNITLIKGDLLCPETLDKLCVKSATVINLAYLRDRSREDNLIASNNLLEACIKAKVGRFIHLSTALVFGRVSGDVVNENTECNPVGEYEITKLQIEKIVLERASGAFEAVILRPTAVFGPGGKNLLKLADDLKSGNKIANYLKSCLFGVRKMNLVSVRNVVSAVELLIRMDMRIDREIFIVSDDEFQSNNYSYVERYLVDSLGFTGYSMPVIPIPHPVLGMLLRLAGKSNSNPRRTYNCQKLLNLGLRKTVLFEDGLADFADWYKHCAKVEKVVA